MSVWFWAAVVGVGGLGAIARFLLDAVVSQAATSGLPFGTFAINMLGSFVLGLLTGLGVTGDALLLAGTATIGSFTTFSTWMLESYRLAEDTEQAAARANVVGSLALGFGAAFLGRTIGVQL
jgi:fluoride exporter